MYRPFHTSQPGSYRDHNHRPYFGSRPPYQQQHVYQNYSSPPQSSREFWCETCDRDFRSSQQLDTHKEQHQICKIDGCQFVAHPKVITKHIQMQHSSGLFKKIAKLTNPEEISKWREERKKKYPTKLNIEKKVAEVQEKISRGEKMCLNREKPTHRGNSGLKRNNKHISHDNQNRRQNKPKQRKRPPPKVAKLANVTRDNFGLKPFAGIQNILMDSDSESEDKVPLNDCSFVIEDEEDGIAPEETQVKPIDKPLVCCVLSNLMCNYGSSDEECEVGKDPVIDLKNAIIKDHKPHVNIAQQSILKESGDRGGSKLTEISNLPKQVEMSVNICCDDDSGPEEVQTVSKQTNTELGNSNNNEQKEALVNKKQNQRQPPRHPPKRYKPKPPSTLLGNLLKQEIRHERNVILQCVRYIVKNNYFDKIN